MAFPNLFSGRGRGGGGSGGAAASPPPLARFSSLHTVKHIAQGGATYNGYTGHNVVTAEAEFDAVRIAFAHMSGEATPGSITAAKVAPSSALGDAITPVNAAGAADNTLWVPLTFDKGGRGGDPDEVISAGSRLNFGGLPARTTLVGTAFVDRPVFSDLVPVRSLARADGAAFPFLFVRVYSSGRLHLNGGTGALTKWAGYDQGRTVKSFNKFGDGVTAPASFTTPTGDESVFHHAAQFQHRRRGLSVMTLGDSTFQGDQIDINSGHHLSPMFLACTALSTPAFPVSHGNFAHTGARSVGWVKQAQIYLDAYRPDVIEIPLHTPNDANSQANTDFVFAQALKIAEYANQRGTVPILVLPIPWNWTGPTLATMLDLVARAKAMVPSYAFVADRYSAVSDPAGSGGTTLAAYVSAGAYHMNQAGAQLLATAIYVPILRKIMAGRPTP